MDRLLRMAHGVARGGAWFGGALILAAAVLVAADVVIRNLFVVSVGGSDELAGYALAVGSAWALAFALLERAHVRIDVLYRIMSKCNAGEPNNPYRNQKMNLLIHAFALVGNCSADPFRSVSSS